MSTIPLEVGDICWARTPEGLQRVEYTGRERDAVMDLTRPEQYARVARRVADRLGLSAGAVEVISASSGRWVVLVGSEARVVVGKDEEIVFASVLRGEVEVPDRRTLELEAQVAELRLRLVGYEKEEERQAEASRKLRADIAGLAARSVGDRSIVHPITIPDAERMLNEAVEAARKSDEADLAVGVTPFESLPSVPAAAVSDVAAAVPAPRRGRKGKGS